MAIEGGAGSSGVAPSTAFVLLSEGCVGDILSHTSPRDACRASSVSRGFKFFADSNAVWERFLPADYLDIISRSVSPVLYSSKKELYFRLCDSILIDDGKMSFTLNKNNGKKCFLIGANELSIAWKDTLVFWRWRSLPESRFPEVAELLAVCWLEIRGTFKTTMLSPHTTYEVYLVFNIGATSHCLNFPAKMAVRRVGGSQNAPEEEVKTVVYLRPPKTTCEQRLQVASEHTYAAEDTRRVPHVRRDGWVEIKLGEFYTDENDSEVDVCFMETQQLHWKSGLIVEGIDIRPKNGE